MQATVRRDLNPSYEELWISKLKVHPKVQREFDDKHARQIAMNWHPVALTTPTVVQMTSGDRGFYIIDGQHRVWASQKVGNKRIVCKVVKAKTHAEMNAIFLLINNGTKKVSPLDEYLMSSRNDSGSADYRIKQILSKEGIEIAKRNPIGYISAVAEVRAIMAQSGIGGMQNAARAFAAIAASGSKIDQATVRAVRQLVRKYADQPWRIEKIIESLRDNFPAMYSNAASRCIGTRLSDARSVLRDEIDVFVFGEVVPSDALAA